jgi:hypothetical protein
MEKLLQGGAKWTKWADPTAWRSLHELLCCVRSYWGPYSMPHARIWYPKRAEARLSPTLPAKTSIKSDCVMQRGMTSFRPKACRTHVFLLGGFCLCEISFGEDWMSEPRHMKALPPSLRRHPGGCPRTIGGASEGRVACSFALAAVRCSRTCARCAPTATVLSVGFLAETFCVARGPRWDPSVEGCTSGAGLSSGYLRKESPCAATPRG